MKKILIVDDDQDIRYLVKYILIENGFDVFAYATGLNVARIVERYKPNLILLDIQLPGAKKGTQICKEIKEK